MMTGGTPMAMETQIRSNVSSHGAAFQMGDPQEPGGLKKPNLDDLGVPPQTQKFNVASSD